MTRITSRIAYKEINEDGTKVSQSDYIYSIVASIPGEYKELGYTLKEISRRTKLEINSVAGRVNELKTNGSLKESDKRKCRITGRLVTPVTLA